MCVSFLVCRGLCITSLLRLGLRDCYRNCEGTVANASPKPDFTAPWRAASHRVAMSGKAEGEYAERSRNPRAMKNEATGAAMNETRHDSGQKLKPLKPQWDSFRLRRLCVGRLDWIRTNDPHHVKVVL
jgi:hypothetical protein